MKGLLLVTAVSIPAVTFSFGGWAVTTVENVPEYVVAGKPFEVAYSVRQHGFTLLSRLSGTITVSAGNAARNFAAVEAGEGMYKSQVTIPSSGLWTVQISNGFLPGSGTRFTVRAVAESSPAPSPMPAAERGQQLFLAKGCANCHTHQLTKDFSKADVGPDLSEPKFSNAYLARFLANPNVKTDWKSAARMPNLGIKPAEIAALTAFLNR